MARKILGFLEGRIYGIYCFTRKLQTPQYIPHPQHRTGKAAGRMLTTNMVLLGLWTIPQWGESAAFTSFEEMTDYQDVGGNQFCIVGTHRKFKDRIR